MDDLISRQAAIDAILAIKDYGNSDRANALGLAECAVTTLPSVQPEQIARDISTIIENEKDMRVILNEPSAQPEIIHCGDCKYKDDGIDEDGIPFLKCLNGRSYGGTRINDYCSWAERRQDADSSGNMSGTQKALKHTETHSCENKRTETHGWIPVSEALPEDGVTVWVTIRGHDVITCEEGETLEQAIARISRIRWVTQGYWSEEEHGWNDPSFGCPLMVKPIAWMPMEVPEPYKEEQDVNH